MSGEIRCWTRVRVRPIPPDGSGHAAVFLWPFPGEPGYGDGGTKATIAWFTETFKNCVFAAASAYGDRPVEMTATFEHGVWR